MNESVTTITNPLKVNKLLVCTCRLLVGGTGPVRESVLEGADLAVRGAGVAVGARGDDGVAAAEEDADVPEDSGDTPGELLVIT